MISLSEQQLFPIMISENFCKRREANTSTLLGTSNTFIRTWYLTVFQM